MRILFLTHSFNSLTQRLFVELTRCGHEVSIELDINDTVSEEAVALFAPDLVIAPFLKRAIPASIWEQRVCLVVHPGIVGDRGPSSLDWAIADRVRTWGVTVLQANAVMDGGDVWAHVEFPMRFARKSSLYRNEVSDAAAEAVLLAVERFAGGTFRASRVDPTDRRVRGRERPPMTRDDRRIDWARDDTETVLCRIHAADGYPGVVDTVAGLEVHLYNAVAEDRLRGEPGSIVATRDGAVCRATVDGAVWITHLKRANHGREALKLPATHVLAGRLAGVPHDPLPLPVEPGRRTLHEIRYREHGPVGYLHFDFYNGAMSTARCERLRDAYLHACGRDVRVIVLMGGHDFWSNGIDLNLIESAASPADESWRNINAMDDLCKEIVLTGDKLTIAAMQGNAGAGGVFLALSADQVVARSSVILNPHYKSMGNLHGSEYWTYLLPRRMGHERARSMMESRLPVGAAGAASAGLLDAALAGDVPTFREAVRRRAEILARPGTFREQLAAKRARRTLDEREKPLQAYRDEELARMHLNFYGFDPSYHVARYNFVHKRAHSWTPLHLAKHRRRIGPRHEGRAA